MYFDTKSYLKSNHYHTSKHILNQQLELQREKERQMTTMMMKVVAMNQPARKR